MRRILQSLVSKLFPFFLYLQINKSYFIGRGWLKTTVNLYTSISLQNDLSIASRNPYLSPPLPSAIPANPSPNSTKEKFLNVTNSTRRIVNNEVVKLFQQAQAFIRKNDHYNARKLLKRCLEMNKQDSHSWLALAQLEVKTGQIEAAKKLFVDGAQECPNSVHIYHAWGQFEQKYGNLTLARDCWSKALHIEPLNPYVGHTLAALEIRLGNPLKAKEILDEFVSKKPTGPICISLAELERNLGNPNRSKEILSKALETCPSTDHVPILLSLAWIVEDAFQNIDLAFKFVQKAIELDPYRIQSYIAKANVALRRNNIELAKQTLYHSISLTSKQQQNQQQQQTTTTSSSFSSTNKSRNNRKDFSLDGKKQEFLGQHYTMLATIELENGQIYAARKVIEEGAQLYPNDYFLLQRYGSLEAKYGNVSLARQLFAQSIKIKPHAPTYVSWALLEVAEAGKFSSETIQSAYHDHIVSTAVEKSSSSNANSEGAAAGGGYDGSLFDLTTSFVPNNISMPSAAAAYEQQQFHLNKARQLFQTGMKVDPLHAPLYHAYANTELRFGNLTLAKEIFLKGIAQNCYEISCLYHGLGLLEEKNDNYLEAKRIYYYGIKRSFQNKRDLDSSVMYLFHSLGMLELKYKHYQQGIKIFTTGISLFPYNSQLQLGLALVYSKMNEITKSRQYFQQSVSYDPYHLHAWQSWAVVEKQLGNYEIARTLFKNGLKHGQNHGPLWQGYAVMEVQLGNYDLAKVLFKEAVQRSPYHAQSYQAWACLEVKLGNIERAKELVEEGLQRCPSHAALWSVATIIEEKLGNIDQARRLGYTGVKLFPKHGPLFKILGELESRVGNKFKARELFWKGIQMDPSYSSTYHVAALFEAKNGNLEKLSELHAMAKDLFSKDDKDSEKAEQDYDIFRKIHELQKADSKSKLEDIVNTQSDSMHSQFLNEFSS